MTDNDSLEIKKRSRRRLVGAAALALLAAIVLPMVMDQETGSPTQDIQVSIPDRDADGAARPIAGRPPQPVEPQLAPPPEEQPPTAVAPVEAPPDPAQPDEGPAAQPSSAPVAQAKPDGPAKPAAPAGPDTPAKPAPAPGGDDGARARALLEGQAPVAAARQESYVVQVGAFGESSKAVSLSAELKGRGFTAYTEKSGTVTRVRVGPFASRDQAEKAAERLRASGHSGVVAPR